MKPFGAAGLFCLALSASSALADTQTFDDVRWIVPNGKGTRDVKVVLSLEDDRVVLASHDGEVLRSIPYESLETISNSVVRRRRWTGGLLTGSFISPLGYGLLFTKSKKHYITLFEKDEATVVKLDGEDYATVLAMLARRAPQPPIQVSR